MRNLLAVIGLTVIFVSTGLSICLSLTKADQPNAEKTSAEQDDSASIDVRFARAHLALAKFDLRRAIQLNNRLPNSLPATRIEKLRRHVTIDEEQLKQYLMAEDADFHEICIRSAEVAVEIAMTDVRRSREAHERMPSASSALDVERADLMANLAKLNLERIGVQDASTSRLSHLQWQIEELRNQVLDLQLQKGL